MPFIKDYSLTWGYIGKYPEWQPSANTIAYYKLDGDLKDSSGNWYDATESGGTITYGTNYATFTDWYARFDNGYSSWTITDDITISLWARNIQASWGEWNIFVFGQDGFGNGRWILIRINGTTSNEYLAMSVSQGTSWVLQQTSVYSVTANVWHNLVVTVSPTDKKMIFYIDWVAKETVTTGTNIRVDGKSSIGKVWNYSHFVTGDVSEVINEKIAWSAADVLSYYNGTKSKYWL